MRQLKLLGLALLAIFALGAMASASALALENPEILPNPTAEKPLTFTSKGGKASLNSFAGKKSIKCEKTTNEGKFTSARLGFVTIDFTECLNGEAGVKCWSLGDPKGTILLGSYDIHLVDLLENNKKEKILTLGAAVIILDPKSVKENELHLECQGGLLILILGAVLGEVLGPKGEVLTSPAKVKEVNLVFRQTEPGVQQYRDCSFPIEFCGKEGARKEIELKTNFGGGEELSSEVTEDTITFAKEAEVDF